MKKTLAIVLTAVMILSLAAVCVSAYTIPDGKVAADYKPEGTAISTAAELEAIKSGNYYLTADITATKTVKEFKGTLDGNGHTITVSAPLFETFSGNAFNLTLAGAITSDGDAGAFAIDVDDDSYFENVVNNCRITVNGGSDAAYAGGLIAMSETDCYVTMKNCANFADVSLSTEFTDKSCAGGLVGLGNSLYAVGCVNKGNVTNTNATDGKAGGIAGSVALIASYNYAVFTDCDNYGNIVSAKDAGGICAYCGLKNNYAIESDGFNFYYCANYGDITGGRYTSGIDGYTYGSDGKSEYTEVSFCISTGTLLGGRSDSVDEKLLDYISYFIPYTNTIKTKINNCIGIGAIGKRTDIDKVSELPMSFIGCSSANSLKYTYENVFICDDGLLKTYSYGSDSNASTAQHTWEESGFLAKGIIERITAAQVGDAIAALNKAAGANIIVVDAKGNPAFDAALRAQRIAKDEHTPIEFKEPEIVTTEEQTPMTTVPETDPVTQAPGNTDAPATEPVKEEKKGCGSALASLAIVSVMSLGATIIRKKH